MKQKAKRALVAVLRTAGLVQAMWAVFIITVMFIPLGIDLREYGVIPRQFDGLLGIITMHFLHAHLLHLVVNSIGIFLVLIPLFLSFDGEFHMPEVIFKICILGGTLLWLMGRPHDHIGASLLCYGLTTYMLMGAIVHHKEALLFYALMTLSLNAFTFVSGMIPSDPTISWEGHLCGAIAGILVALGEKYRSQTQLPAEGK